MQSVGDDSDVPEEEDLIGAQRPGAVDAAVELCAVLRMAEEARAPADGRRQRPRELQGLRTPQPQEQQEQRGGHRKQP